MSNSLADVSSNWSHVGGCTLLQSCQESPADPDFFTRPELNQLIHDEKSILLNKELSSEHCELYIKLFADHKIQAVSFVCNVVKVEIFQGPIKEYMQTIYGVLVDEEDDLFKSYRYDIEFEKSGITDLTLRFITDSSDVCIFGILLHTAPNPNGITTLMPNTRCTNTENMLQNSTQPSNSVADQFEKLLKLVTKSNQYNTLKSDQHTTKELNVDVDEMGLNFKNVLEVLKTHIDERFEQMEKSLRGHLKDMEKRQNEKLDIILKTLETIHK